MKSKISNIRDGVATRLREARELLGLKQAELATLTAISRSTQIAYEKGTTEPTTGYLQAAQRAGLDIDAVLFGPREEIDHAAPPPARGQPDWVLIQECCDTVDFFCLRFAPTCPASYRWKLIRQLYEALSAALLQEPEAPQPPSLEVLSTLWADYGK